MRDEPVRGAAALVSADWLAAQHDDGVVVLEIAAEPDQRTYATGHVPGARCAFWQALLWADPERRFPTAEELRSRLEGYGVGAESTLVLYGDPVQYGTYAYWVIAMTGAHRDVRLLDGGKRGWSASGHRLETGPEDAAGRPSDGASRRPRSGEGTNAAAEPACVAHRDDVLAVVRGDAPYVLVDARSPEEYEGSRVSPPHFEVDHGAQRTGRIPGAVHVPHDDLLAADDRFRPPAELRRLLTSVGVDEHTPAITYCRLSHRATLVWFALTRLLDFPDVRVYDGSWTEWGSMVGMPIEK